MSLFLQDDTFWYEFTINRKRYRSSTCTADRATALKVEAEHRVSLKLTGKRASATLDGLKIARAEQRCTTRWTQAGIETKRHVLEKPQVPKARTNISPASTLLHACGFLLGLGSMRWAKKTMEYNRAAAERLIEFFGPEMTLKKFNISHFEHYQQSRSKTCGASAVNRELQFSEPPSYSGRSMAYHQTALSTAQRNRMEGSTYFYRRGAGTHLFCACH